MDYKNTLNLPHTTFPMKANLTQMEPAILQRWEQMHIYDTIREHNRDNDTFVLHDGPPYANGSIHMGHALNKILKDIIIKFKMLQGLNTPFIVGWDCHGLPVEHQLCKDLGVSKHDIDVVTFRKKAKKFALKFVELQKKDFQRLGIFSDWENPYLTLSGNYEYWVMMLLKDLVANGYVYRGRKPVNWCATCETALAEAEVEYADKESHSIYFLFSLAHGNKWLCGENYYFLAWTTTPWTIISNVAVAVHPDFTYGIYEYQGKNIILAKRLAKNVEEKIGHSLKERGTIKGEALEGIMLKHPFCQRLSPVVLADFISPDEGSGCVHIAPGHGQEDFSLVKKYDLNIIMPVDDKGKFTDEAGDFEGLNVSAANTRVIEKLAHDKSLLKHETITHSYPHCWRCKNPIIFRATHQWFLNIDHNNLRDHLRNAIEGIRWVPTSGIERMRSMIDSRPDWCLSRQRLWGIPIPAVRCGGCSNIILDPRIIEIAANSFRAKSSNSWFEDDISSFIPEDFVCPACGKKDFSKEYDILDVWFESGASFLAVVKNNNLLKFPADIYLEGSDQHRGWFQVSLIPSVAIYRQSPFKTLLTHGFVVDGEGKKMSKSLGNVISPQEIIKAHGAEIVRLWVSANDYTEDIKLSPQIIEQLVDMYRKIRNTLRFMLGNIYDFTPEDMLEPSALEEIDAFMLAKTSILYTEIRKDYEQFNFHRVCQKIFNFTNLDLSSFYLDILKDKLYTYSKNSNQRRSAQTVLSIILKVLLKLIAPILPFTAEEAFGHFPGWPAKQASIYLHCFAEDTVLSRVDESIIASGARLLQLRTKVLKEIERKREASLIGTSLEVQAELWFDGDDYDFYQARRELIEEVCIVSKVTIHRGEPKIIIRKADGKKCPRCWHYREDIGHDAQYGDVCPRCATALKGGTND